MGIKIIEISNKKLWIMVDIFVLLLDWILVELCIIIWVIGNLFIRLDNIFLVFWVNNFLLVGVIFFFGFNLFVVFIYKSVFRFVIKVIVNVII